MNNITSFFESYPVHPKKYLSVDQLGQADDSPPYDFDLYKYFAPMALDNPQKRTIFSFLFPLSLFLLTIDYFQLFDKSVLHSDDAVALGSKTFIVGNNDQRLFKLITKGEK